MIWHVLYTKPRNEKKVTDRLQQLGFKVYCPIVEELQQWSDRKKKVLKPLLPSYVFIQIEEKNKNEVFQVPGIVKYLYWLGKPALVRDSEIEQLKKWNLHYGMMLKVEKYNPGSKITLNEGIFKGVEALVKEQRKNKLQLVLETLGIVLIVDLPKE